MRVHAPCFSSLPAAHSGRHRLGLPSSLASIAWLALTCVGQQVAAQEAVAPAGRGGLRVNPITSEVTAVHSHVMAPTALGPAPNGWPTNELAGISYRLWLSRGRAELGMGIGTLGYLAPPPDGRFDGPRMLSGSVPTMTVGVRYRVSPESAVYADASSALGLGGGGAAADYYSTKVGMEWKPAKSRIGLEGRSLGIQFDSGYRLSLRARKGGFGVYLRSQF